MANILIGITGGIAAYKIIILSRLLRKQGHKIRFVLSEHAGEFVTPLTLQAISGEAVRSALFDESAEQGMSHIELARWADIYLIAPASANTIGKLAQGIADNLLTTLYLVTDARIVIAPAMNHQMWAHPAVQANLALLAARGKHEILPVNEGEQACGENGAGRLLEPEEIAARLFIPQTLSGKHIVITAGPTREAIDPVRYLTNRSSGKMGYALARAAAEQGARVTLISGPTALDTPAGCTRIDVESALDMHRAAMEHAAGADCFIAAAAVADYRIANPSPQKHKKTVHGALTLELVENPDIVASVAALAHDRPYVVGFAAETDNVLAYARQKRENKQLDMIIANDVREDVFASDHNHATLITAHGETPLPRARKSAIARQILDILTPHLEKPPVCNASA
ncbi:MAG: bifunctional phosphopantothenoylcysteine decarboxylase/phosphopantothenate--cysteine ligase CoaBC [Cardiobacteriaceae bacterium]|nr:bifunctional phosphopantothenoylcysteine decarboxylase/phosphopantothenate--cysteine ligase CoaBC [Cardiobacteriaceae bacterium]